MSGDANWLRPIVVGFPREIVVEAAYYAVRELKQASVPHESRKEHLVDAPSSEPSPEAIDLASRIMLSILAREGIPLDDLSHETFTSYVGQLLNVVREASEEVLRHDPLRARALLERLRAS